MDKVPEVTPEVEVKQTEPTIAEVEKKVEVTPEPKEATVSEALEKKTDDSVPLATFLEAKKANKELTQRLQDLAEKAVDDTPKGEVVADIKALSEKYDVDEDLLKDIVASARREAEKEIDSKIDQRFAPLEEKEKADKFNKTFEEHFTKAMDRMPEFDGVVNKDVIMALTRDPNNASKTFPQLIEAAYGHLLQGKRTVDTGSSRTGKEDNMIVDIAKAKTDSEYFKMVMSDPNLKKQYNDKMVSGLQNIL